MKGNLDGHISWEKIDMIMVLGSRKVIIFRSQITNFKSREKSIYLGSNANLKFIRKI